MVEFPEQYADAINECVRGKADAVVALDMQVGLRASALGLGKCTCLDAPQRGRSPITGRSAVAWRRNKGTRARASHSRACKP